MDVLMWLRPFEVGDGGGPWRGLWFIPEDNGSVDGVDVVGRDEYCVPYANW